MTTPSAVRPDDIDLEPHRPALTGHCYRMLGSPAEAEDAVQETMIRAWRNLDRFEGRSSLRTWLFRIATRVCLDMLEARERRAMPMDLGPAGDTEMTLVELPASRWIEPIPDARALPADATPEERAVLKENIRLAFVAALQHLTPRQRAVLLWTEVVGGTAAEIAEILATSVASVNSALQRARATLATKDVSRGKGPLSEAQIALVDEYVRAFERYDMDALTALLREDATMCMPPYTLWLRGPQAIRDWMLGRGAACRDSRLVPTRACGAPAFGQYKPDPAGGPRKPWALITLEFDGDAISGLTYFLDTQALFPLFGLPPELP
ncbi:MAG TPA: sigma-70 family RNA polymerase sigma factor [Vulgatibacter sp.]|nr:sigma-70 family RNA polymerase sigma factor [Vulgatibacter sp.]